MAFWLENGCNLMGILFALGLIILILQEGGLPLDNIPVKAIEKESYTRTVADTEITVHNVSPIFLSNEALEDEIKEITNVLYQVFSKY